MNVRPSSPVNKPHRQKPNTVPAPWLSHSDIPEPRARRRRARSTNPLGPVNPQGEQNFDGFLVLDCIGEDMGGFVEEGGAGWVWWRMDEGLWVWMMFGRGADGEGTWNVWRAMEGLSTS